MLIIIAVPQRLVAQLAIGMHAPAWVNGVLDKGDQLSADGPRIRRRRIRPMRRPSTSTANCDERFGLRLPVLSSGMHATDVALQPQRTHASLLAGDPLHRPKPDRNGVRVSWKTVPGVTDVWMPQATHWSSVPRTGHASSRLHRGHQNPSGQSM